MTGTDRNQDRFDDDELSAVDGGILARPKRFPHPLAKLHEEQIARDLADYLRNSAES
jgi:hypothetical protein